MSDRTSTGGTARGCRAPMPWTAGPGAGFTTGQPWLRFGLDADTRNVAAAGGRPVVGAVAVSPAHRIAGDEPGAPARDAPARSGRDRTISSPTPGRPTGRVLVVVFNLGRSRASWRLPDASPDGAWRPILGTSPDPAPGEAIAGRDRARSSRPTRRASSSGSADRPAHRPCYHDGRSTVTIPGSTTCRLIS